MATYISHSVTLTKYSLNVFQIFCPKYFFLQKFHRSATLFILKCVIKLKIYINKIRAKICIGLKQF